MGIINNISGDLEREAARLFSNLHSSLMAEAEALCGDRAAAEDLVMQTIERLCSADCRYDEEKGGIFPYARKVLKNEYLKSIRGKMRKAVVYIDPDELAIISDERAENLQGVEAASEENSETVRAAIASLSPEMREIIMLRHFDECTIPKIARILGLSENSVRCRLHYARKVLAKRLSRLRKPKALSVLAAAFLAVISFAAVKTGVLSFAAGGDAPVLDGGLSPSGDVALAQGDGPAAADAAPLAADAAVSNAGISIEQQEGQNMNTNIRTMVIAAASLAAAPILATTPAAALAASASALATTIDPSNYDYSMTISPAPGKITTTLSNFPLLVRLSSARQQSFNSSDCGTNGADLRFALADGTLLSHEIDTWSTTGESAVWVNVPSLAADTEIKVYWGVKDSSLAPAVNAADAWPDFIAVYHLGEGNATALDSSGNGYTAVNAKAVTAGSDPKVGGCASIHDMFVTTPAVTDLTASTAAKPLADRSRVTFSGWVAVDSFNTANLTYAQNSRVEIARKFDVGQRGKGGFSCRYFADNAYSTWAHTPNPLFGIFMDHSGSGATVNWNTTAPQSNGGWLYLVCTVDGTTGAKYVNGAAMSDSPTTLGHTILGPDTITLDFGAADNSTDCQTYARMDEVRIRNGAVSAAWAAADYAQQTDAAFLVFEENSDETFVVSAIPDQVVESAAELQAGVTPSVTVSNLTTSTELGLGTDYTVAYENNTSAGIATAVVTGINTYEGHIARVGFTIIVMTPYYIVGGDTAEDSNSSTISGAGSSTGWSTTRGGTKSAAGITAEKAIYYVWTDRWNRTPNVNFHTPQSSKIVVDPGCTWELADKMMDKTLALNNLSVGTGGILKISPANDSNGVFNNTLSGSCDLAEGATLQLSASKDANSAKQYTLNATVTGRGAILMPSTSTAYAYSGTLANKIAGDMTGFTGDIETWNGYNAVSLELVNAVSLPGDPLPSETAYVVVTNSATLKIDNDWISPTNRIWILGDSGTPTIEVPAGKTVTVRGDLVGTVGFNKTGAGTLVLRGASEALTGEITISAGTLRLDGQATRLNGAAGVTITEAGGTLAVAGFYVPDIPAQTVYSLDDLAAGVGCDFLR